jgi:integrase
MAGRRGNHEGSIYQRKDGRWAASITLSYEGGKRSQKTYYGSTQREVHEQLTKARHARRQRTSHINFA